MFVLANPDFRVCGSDMFRLGTFVAPPQLESHEIIGEQHTATCFVRLSSDLFVEMYANVSVAEHTTQV